MILVCREFHSALSPSRWKLSSSLVPAPKCAASSHHSNNYPAPFDYFLRSIEGDAHQDCGKVDDYELISRRRYAERPCCGKEVHGLCLKRTDLRPNVFLDTDLLSSLFRL